MKRKILLVITLALCSMLFVACAPAENTDNTETTGKIKAVSTIGMINDVVKNVGGDHVDAVSLMGPGVDPHLYKASEGDVTLLSSADIIFYNGLHLEAKLGEVLEQMSARTEVVVVTANLPRDQLLASEDYEDQYDPHVWFDVTFWKSTTESVRDALVELDPANAEAYKANAQAYLAKQDELHEYVLSRTQEIPEESRVVVTAHDAFRYFGSAYGFEVTGLQGISTEAEAGTSDVQDLVNFIIERQIKAIFVESSVPERNIKAVQEAASAKGWEVTVGGELFSDAMGDEGTVEGTYLGMVEHNINTIADALK